MSNSNIKTWDLQTIISDLAQNHKEIQEIYLFGSRAYNTNSYRSDLDLLAVSSSIIAISSINSWLHDKYPLVDLFISFDGKHATSVINGSVVCYRGDSKKFSNLFEQLDAVKLWDRTNSFSKDTSINWNPQTLQNVDFQMSIIPSYPLGNFKATLNKALANLEASGIKAFFSGSTWPEMAKSIVKMIEIAMSKPTEYARKANSYSFELLKLDNEYDFQNYIHTILRPVFTDIQPEPIMIRVDGADKKADFAIASNKIVIEAKWIESKSKKAEVLKTLEGLKDFYSQNANIRCLIFLILYDNENVELDKAFLEYQYSYERETPQIIVRFFENKFRGKREKETKVHKH